MEGVVCVSVVVDEAVGVTVKGGIPVEGDDVGGGGQALVGFDVVCSALGVR